MCGTMRITDVLSDGNSLWSTGTYVSRYKKRKKKRERKETNFYLLIENILERYTRPRVRRKRKEREHNSSPLSVYALIIRINTVI